MELIYLWVEEYKNIKKQGFNFSPKFTCKYDGEKKELSIDENKEYVSIFPDNINITAIVGENGSGKSGVLELIALDSIYPSSSQDESFISPLSPTYKYFCIYYEEGNFYHKKHFMDSITLKSEELKKIPYYLHYDYSFSKMPYYDDINRASNIFLFPAKKEKFDNHILNDEMKNILLIVKNNFYNKLKDERYFNPDQLSIKFVNQAKNQKSNILTSLDRYSDYLKLLIFDSYEIFAKEAGLNDIFQVPKLNEQRTNWDKIFKNVSTNGLVGQAMRDEIERFNKLLNNFEKFANLFLKNNDEILTEIEKKYGQNNEPLKKMRIDEYRRNLQIRQLNDEIIDLLIDLPRSIQLEIFDNTKGISYNHLSNGEKALLNIRLYLENVISRQPDKNYIILMDEAETDLHPQWQKKVVNYLIDSFYGRKIHFIFSSHSPFILSDLPKENVIFLEKYTEKEIEDNHLDQKVGNCKNATKDVKINPFGANIHTLLSHGFFMKDGLMGEFAKAKINQIIEFHSHVKEENKKEIKDISGLKAEYEDRKTEFWYIQKILGETYLQQVIKNHLIEIEKILLGKDEAKQQEINRLRAEADRLDALL